MIFLVLKRKMMYVGRSDVSPNIAKHQQHATLFPSTCGTVVTLTVLFPEWVCLW